MKNVNEVNVKELVVVNESNQKEFLMIPNTPMCQEIVEKYRVQLVERYKESIFNNWDERRNLDLTDELMREAVMVMDASDEEILKMFFEDANDKAADMDGQDYFNQLFEVAT
ncbi:hypothetical protein MKX57_11210 [Lysinibacillus sp. FSL M8-0216]|uniref:hypothetical protein n=1 Tax=Lysinibacillus sp. FSL M8-0216 TaxID=2921619 RepID=UPI00315A438E